MQSELGQVVLGMADQDAKLAMEDFDAAPITDQAKLLNAKVDYRVALRFQQYLQDLITRGREAMDSMKSN